MLNSPALFNGRGHWRNEGGKKKDNESDAVRFRGHDVCTGGLILAVSLRRLTENVPHGGFFSTASWFTGADNM